MTFICKHCGVEFEGLPGQTDRVFCSKKCYRGFLNGQSHIICPHNKEVVCDEKRCYACGWNPEVEKRRKEKLFGIGEAQTING